MEIVKHFSFLNFMGIIHIILNKAKELYLEPIMYIFLIWMHANDTMISL